MNLEKVKIFLSYAREDREKVEVIYDKLSRAGFNPWMDTKDILPGEQWQKSIENAIKDSHFFLVCLSEKSIKRGMIQKEIRIAFELWSEMFENDIYLIPIRLEECKIPDKISKFQYIDLFIGNEEGFTKLKDAIQEGMKRRGLINKVLKTANIGELLLNISHDFRTVLALIEGETQWLIHLKEEKKLTEEEVISSIKKINSYSGRAIKLIEVLVEKSKLLY